VEAAIDWRRLHPLIRHICFSQGLTVASGATIEPNDPLNYGLRKFFCSSHDRYLICFEALQLVALRWSESESRRSSQQTKSVIIPFLVAKMRTCQAPTMPWDIAFSSLKLQASPVYFREGMLDFPPFQICARDLDVDHKMRNHVSIPRWQRASSSILLGDTATECRQRGS
jgi:hypothetical protein